MAGELPVAVISFHGPGAVNPKGTMTKVQDVAIRELGRKLAAASYLDLKEDLKKEAFPTTSVRKVKKPVLKRKVRELVSARTKLGLDNDASLIESTEDSLSGVWSIVSRLPREKFHPHLDVFTVVDSITAMRFCGTVRTRLGKDISVADINENPTIRHKHYCWIQKQLQRLSQLWRNAVVHLEPMIWRTAMAVIQLRRKQEKLQRNS